MAQDPFATHTFPFAYRVWCRRSSTSSLRPHVLVQPPGLAGDRRRGRLPLCPGPARRRAPGWPSGSPCAWRSPPAADRQPAPGPQRRRGHRRRHDRRRPLHDRRAPAGARRDAGHRRPDARVGMFLIPLAYAIWAERLIDVDALRRVAIVSAPAIAIYLALRLGIPTVGREQVAGYGGSLFGSHSRAPRRPRQIPDGAAAHVHGLRAPVVHRPVRVAQHAPGPARPRPRRAVRRVDDLRARLGAHHPARRPDLLRRGRLRPARQARAEHRHARGLRGADRRLRRLHAAQRRADGHHRDRPALPTPCVDQTSSPPLPILAPCWPRWPLCSPR